MTEEYRNQLIEAEQRAQSDYDKTIVSLSGGALGLSILFIKNIIGDSAPREVWMVIVAWVLWAGSLTSVVVSYFTSRMAHRKTIDQNDKGDFTAGVGGRAAIATGILNVISGVLFILGIVFLIAFAANNLGEQEMGDKKVEKGAVPPPPPPKKGTGQDGAVPPPPPPPPPKKKS